MPHLPRPHLRQMGFSLAAALALAPLSPVFANDGFGGLSATGLSFGNTDAVTMLSEDLFIGLDRISVDYLFKNTSEQDVTGQMIFPLPPISVWSLYQGMINLPEAPFPDNLVGFTAVVDGKPVAVSIDRIAVIEAEHSEGSPESVYYDTPGREVTARLNQEGLPLSLDIDQVSAALAALPDRQAALERDGIAVWYEGETDDAARLGFPQWSIIYRYHWTQTFPAGAELRVSHDYNNYPAGGLLFWQHPASEDYLQEMIAAYCIDEGTSKAMAKAVQGTDPDSGEATQLGIGYFLSYVLRTANSWAGPIGHFRLTLDKGRPENVISLCADGLKKTSATTFALERSDYTPTQDLQIMIVEALRPEP